ncbi:hypothetical protein RvY_13870-2 [Ramazzottius varieornatus]|uniref:Cytospin-A n=1 Tax=Ramazzottius varieornatus TaxID=947166 RepID=A0A1D1VUK5_RAMVA|nr:hypothetical protein RvY_13870-2 [Ramazzottius varieornatus]
MKSSRTKVAAATSSKSETILRNPVSASSSSTSLAALRALRAGNCTTLPARGPSVKSSETTGSIKTTKRTVEGKSIKKHFLSKSSDSLSALSNLAHKKAKSQTVAVLVSPSPQSQSRGIRHPVATVRKDKEGSLIGGTVLTCSASCSHGLTEQANSSQEMRRSVSSNCLDGPSSVARAGAAGTDRRLSITAHSQLVEEMMPSISLLASHLTPSQPGVTLVSAGTQTDDARKAQAQTVCATDSMTAHQLGEMEFESLLAEHSQMSQQLSDLCKVEHSHGGTGHQSSADYLSSMDGEGMSETDAGGALAKSNQSINDWDAQSNISLCSEPSLAGLQDRIQQMEENHHSTHEELQATLQELSEMSDLVVAYKKENDVLTQEKELLAEKVHVYQTQADSLKKIIYRQSAGDENSSPEEGSSQKEKTLVDLMKGLQEEKEELQSHLDGALEINSKLTAALEDTQNKLHNLDQWCDQVETDKKQAERDVTSAREAAKRLEAEVARYASQLDSEKYKVAQLEAVAKTTSKAELEDLLDHVRQEKNRLDEELAKAKDCINSLERDLAAVQASLKASEDKKAALEVSLATNAQEFAQRLHVKESQSGVLQEEICRLKKELDDLELNGHTKDQQAKQVSEHYESLKEQYLQEQKQWRFFQDDLLTAVRVANDFRTECELRTKSTLEENQLLKRKNDDLTVELERLKAKKAASPPKPLLTIDSESRPRLDPLPLLRSPAEREALTPKTPRTPNQQVSVRSIIQNLESNGQPRQPYRPQASSPVNKSSGIRRRDDNIVRSESNSSLDSADHRLLDFADKYVDDEPSMPGDGLKPILSTKSQRNSLTGERSERKDVHDALGSLTKGKGSKRNALLKFCQDKTIGYSVSGQF